MATIPTLTSLPYPLSEFDRITISGNIQGGLLQDRVIPYSFPDKANLGLEILFTEYRSIAYKYKYTPDGSPKEIVTLSGNITSGSIRVVLKAYQDPTTDKITVAGNVNSGTLVVKGYVYNSTPVPDKVTLTGNIVSGTLV